MALTPAFEGELRRLLAEFRAAHGPVAVPGGSGKALEAWLLMTLAETARSTGSWDVTLCGGDGQELAPGADFRLRDQPGPIAASAPGFVRIVRRDDPTSTFEIHAGLQWLGRSKARHECDVSLLPSVIGGEIRAGSGGCPSGLPVAALECKDKTSPGTSDEMRQTLARMFDLAHVSQTPPGGHTRIFHAAGVTAWGRRSSRYRSFFAGGMFGIVRVGPFQLGARQLSDHYHVRRYDGIYDLGSKAVCDLKKRFRELLGSVDGLRAPAIPPPTAP